RPPLVHARRDRDARRAGRRPPGRGPDDDRERLGAPEKAAPAAPAPLRLVDPPRSHHGRGPLAGRLRARVPESVIVRLPNWLGDTVMAVPAIRALRQALDGERLLLAGPWAAVLGDQALADVLVTYPRSWSGRLSTADTVRGFGGTTAVLLPTSFEAAASALYWGALPAARRQGNHGGAPRCGERRAVRGGGRARDPGAEPRGARRSRAPPRTPRRARRARERRHRCRPPRCGARDARRRPLRPHRSPAHGPAPPGRRAPRRRAVRAVLLPDVPDRSSVHAGDRGARRRRASRRAPRGARVTPLRILHLAANRWWTGSADPTLQLVAGLRARGHEVLLGVIPGDRFETKAREAGLELLPGLALTPGAAARDTLRLRAAIRSEGIDIVHAHHSHDHWLGLIARPALQGRR